MSQIININVGKVGVRIGEKFIQKIAKEHFLDQNNVTGRSEVFFNQTQNGQQESRSVFLDLNPLTIQKINLNNNRYSILEQNLFKANGLNTDLFSQAKYHSGAQLASSAFDFIRKQTQKCDKLSGFLINNSIAGGTGSGMTAQLLSNLSQTYTDSIIQQHFVLPETDNLISPLHIYNTVLAFHYSIELTNFCVMSENKAFERSLMLQENLRPTLDQVNQVHAQHICQITAPYRFSGTINTNQRKTCTNLIPFPRIKFMISSCSSKKQRSIYVQDSFNQINYSKTDFFCNNTTHADVYTMQVNCRDNFAYESEIDGKVRLCMNEANLRFTDWIPNNIHSSISQQISPFPSANMLINSRNVINIFEKWAEVFGVLLRRSAFLDHYISGGMDQMEFIEAESNLNDLISQHIPCSFFDQEQLQDYPEQDNA